MRVYGKELSYVFCSLAFIYKCDAAVKIVPNFLLLIINRRKQFNLSDLKRGKGIVARMLHGVRKRWEMNHANPA
jgi:hypothetical protein